MENDILNMWSPWLKTANSPWEKILHLGVRKQFGENDIIISTGQLVPELYYLQKGEIKMTYINSEGEIKTVWYIGSGHIFGEAPLIRQNESSMIASCVKESVVYTFNRQVIMEMLLSQKSDIIFDILNSMSGKILALIRQVYDLSLTSPKIRLYKLLYFMSTVNGNNELNISQQDLAELLGIHRVTVNRILVALKNNGIIKHDISRKKLTVSSPSGLLELMEELE